MSCRNCQAELKHVAVDLGLSPLCENVVLPTQLNEAELFHPLKVYVCDQCWLAQLHDHVGGEEIFDGKYAYASSISSSWLQHCKRYCQRMMEELKLDGQSLVVEVASNDGYVLRNFVEAKIPCLGIEPATKLANVAESLGVPVIREFFGKQLASKLREQNRLADLMIGNNVLAHVPDLHDFVAGFKLLLAPQGTITFEFPHLLRLLQGNQFDTIYQEHYCYFSVLTLVDVFAKHDLRIFKVEELNTHGGSLRLFVCHQEANAETCNSVQKVINDEIAGGLNRLDTYQGFAREVVDAKFDLLEFLINAKRAGKSVVGYGAPGKGNTLLNYCGIRQDLIEFTVDRNPLKQGSFLPGSRIPVLDPAAIDQRRPDYVLILPWNIKEEIINQLAHIRSWGAKFVVPIPRLTIVD